MTGRPLKFLILIAAMSSGLVLPASADTLSTPPSSLSVPKKTVKHPRHFRKKTKKKTSDLLSNDPQEQVSDQAEVSSQADKKHK